VAALDDDAAIDDHAITLRQILDPFVRRAVKDDHVGKVAAFDRAQTIGHAKDLRIDPGRFNERLRRGVTCDAPPPATTGRQAGRLSSRRRAYLSSRGLDGVRLRLPQPFSFRFGPGSRLDRGE
jgi:hypothetical protein